jgi:hypothetical protein
LTQKRKDNKINTAKEKAAITVGAKKNSCASFTASVATFTGCLTQRGMKKKCWKIQSRNLQWAPKKSPPTQKTHYFSVAFPLRYKIFTI